jgi:hypothetical protein
MKSLNAKYALAVVVLVMVFIPSCRSAAPSEYDVIVALNSSDYDKAMDAAQSLSEFDNRANKSLASMLKSPDPQKRKIFYRIAKYLNDERLQILLDDVKSEMSNYRDIDDICEFLLFLFEHKKTIFTKFETTLSDPWKALLRVSALESCAKLSDKYACGNLKSTLPIQVYGVGIYYPKIDFDLVRDSPTPLVLVQKYGTTQSKETKNYIISALCQAKDSRTVDFIIGVLDKEREVIMDFCILRPLKVWENHKIQRYLSGDQELRKLIDANE